MMRRSCEGRAFAKNYWIVVIFMVIPTFVFYVLYINLKDIIINTRLLSDIALCREQIVHYVHRV